MAISMVREPSETPNINNVDDFVGLRYAYGDKNGYVKDFGNECSSTINDNIFHINSGRLVLQGVECDIDANGVDIMVDSVSATRYYVVYLQVNLSTNQVSILSTHSTSTYPTVDAGDDLTANNTGTARLVLYRFNALNGTISNVVRVVGIIPYPLSDYNINNGSIESRFGDVASYISGIVSDLSYIDGRLTSLGFKQGSIMLGSTQVGTVTRQGNYVIGKIKYTKRYNTSSFNDSLTITSNDGPDTYFYPKVNYLTIVEGIPEQDSYYTCAVNKSPKNWAIFGRAYPYDMDIEFCFGYEADPIT